MLGYLLLNTAITLLCLLLLKYGKGNSTANYYVSLFAILVWFLPYPLLSQLLPAKVISSPIIVSFSQSFTTEIIAATQLKHVNYHEWLVNVFAVFIALGAMLFVMRIIRLTIWQQSVKNDPLFELLPNLTSLHQVPIYTSNQVNTGLLLGLINPVIVISSTVTKPKQRSLIIAHEKQHLQRHDNVKLLLLELCHCLFWWNPLVRKLVQLNRLYIEVKCDEAASKTYGETHYLAELASLMLESQQRKPNNLVCSATSNHSNNMARIKLLKEKKAMNYTNKMAYATVIFMVVASISWHTMANSSLMEQQSKTDNEQQLGALIDLETKITEKGVDGEVSIREAAVKIWTHYNKQASFHVNDDFILNLKVTDKGDAAYIEYEMIEKSDSGEKVVEKPKLTIHYTKQGVIEIDNHNLSQKAYYIKTRIEKTQQPSE